MALNNHASALVHLGRLDEAEALLDEAAPLLEQLRASNVDADAAFDELAAARGDWAHAARLFLANARTSERDPGRKAIFLRQTAIALAHLGADEDALALAATANAICESIGEAAERSAHETLRTGARRRARATRRRSRGPRRAARRRDAGGGQHRPRGRDGAGGMRHPSDVTHPKKGPWRTPDRVRACSSPAIGNGKGTAVVVTETRPAKT